MKTSMIVLAASVVFGAAAFSTAQGCTSSSSTGDDTGPDSTPTVDDCTECVAQSCRPETERCVNDTDCLAILQCIEVVNDGGACTAETTSANGRCLYEQLAACEVTRECDLSNVNGCNNACIGTINPQCPDGGVTNDGGTSAVTSAIAAADCPTGDTSGAAACDTCAASACATQAAACVVTKFSAITPEYDTPCNEYEACRTECRDSDCEGRCATGFAMGKAASDAYDACLAASCASACGDAASGDAGAAADGG